MEIENKNTLPIPAGAPQGSVGSFLWDLIKILLVALIIIVPFRMFIAEPFVVSGSSMIPNFHNKDYLIIDRISYHNAAPKRGEVIVLKYPKDTSQFFIKRIIGLPGEKIRFEGGTPVIINNDHPQGMHLIESYLPAGTETAGRSETVSLGTGQYYVLGDNRTASSDSRIWGILPEDDIVGKVWLRVFPINYFGFFKTPTY